jgi:hypothetical protein
MSCIGNRDDGSPIDGQVSARAANTSTAMNEQLASLDTRQTNDLPASNEPGAMCWTCCQPEEQNLLRGLRHTVVRPCRIAVVHNIACLRSHQ